MASWKNMTLTTRILVAMGLGIIIGSALQLLPEEAANIKDALANGVFNVVGAIFINLLKMMVVPLVFVSLAMGVTKLGDAISLGRIGLKTVSLYLITTAVAITIAIGIATILEPGKGGIDGLEKYTEDITQKAPPFSETLIKMVPKNIIEAMANGDMIPVILFALLFGIGIILSGERGKHVYNFFSDLDAVILKIVELILKLAPYGVFCLVAKTFSTADLGEIKKLIEYFYTVILVLIIHAVVSYSLLLKLVGGLNPLIFFKKMRAAMTFAFSSSSSNATMPVTLDSVENRLGVKNSVASFTVPLGATINMDGTAIMQGVATVFVANAYNIDLTLTQYLLVIFTATAASVGTAGVPSVGLIMLGMVFDQVGLPVEAIAMLWGIDRLLDMTRTAVNVSGDAAISCLIGKSENALDTAVYQDPNAGMIVTAHTKV